jgi:hypothetical protein
MKVRRHITTPTLLLLAILIYSVCRVPQQSHSAASESTGSPGLGQAIALSDFDADGFVDEARLEGSAFHKSVGILLSGTGKRSFLHFTTNRIVHGSLLAQDIDNDGTTDLIWTDNFRRNNVLVWLGDGSGRFEQVDSSQHNREFALGNTPVAESDNSFQETAINFETNSPLDQTLNAKYLDNSAAGPASDYPDRPAPTSAGLRLPTGRAPPFPLS